MGQYPIAQYNDLSNVIALQSNGMGMIIFCSDNVLMAYETWRSTQKEGHGWGLAPYLANEIYFRFYSSHGIVPHVIAHEGLGYYGIQLDPIPCQINSKSTKTLGRLTMSRDVENWIAGGSGDHGLELVKRANRGEPVQPMVQEAIEHLQLPAYPLNSHLNCRHKRWGASYVLIFQIASLMALHHDNRIEIWNDPDHTYPVVRGLDPKIDQKEHMGHFILSKSDIDRRLILAGDVRLLQPYHERSNAT